VNKPGEGCTMKNIISLLDECWSSQPSIELTKKTLIKVFEHYQTCLRSKLSALSSDDQLALATTYLYLLGYSNQEIIVQEKQIMITYDLPGGISVEGLALIISRKNMDLDKHRLVDANEDFFIIFDFSVEPSGTNSIHDSKHIMIYVDDCVRVLVLVLAARLYRYIENSIKMNVELRGWYFEFLISKWMSTFNEIGRLESNWMLLLESDASNHKSSSL